MEALFAFFSLSVSTAIFFYRSKKSKLSLAFSTLSLCLTVWAIALFSCDYQLPLGLRTRVIDLITLAPLFIPILLSYIIFNYTHPNELKFLPIWRIAIHTLVISFFLRLTWESELSPFQVVNDVVRYYENGNYFLYCGYLFGSIALSLLEIYLQYRKGAYFVKLHSLYMGTGILVGLIISTVLSVILPNTGTPLNFVSVIGLLIFLWLTWVPIARYGLFNLDLMDFRLDLRDPKITSAIIIVNRFILNKLDSDAYQSECTKYENERKRLLLAKSKKLLIDRYQLDSKGFRAKTKEYIDYIMSLFLKI